MDMNKIFEQMSDNIETVLQQDSPLGILLWQEFIKLHPADIAQFISDLDKDEAPQIFAKLDRELRVLVFPYLAYSKKVLCLAYLDDRGREHILNNVPLDELTDFFDELSDEELKRYLNLLHTKDRAKVVSLMQFDPESAGGIMHTDVMTLIEDFTIEKSIQILQRLQPSVELHQKIYVTNQRNELLGHINLEDLVLKNPKTRIGSIIRKNELVALVDEDQEKVAHNMVKYKLLSVPVVNEHHIFLGVIPSDALVEILEKEAAEDLYKISALRPIKHTYFETPFFRLLYQRSFILVVLFLVQIFSSIIMVRYHDLLVGFLFLFLTMIQSTGGNSSSQSSALVIQGLSSGELNESNIFRFLRREFMMSSLIGLILGFVSFMRVFVLYGTREHLIDNIAISLSLGIIVVASTFLGSLIPVVLRKLKLDPALSAGPFLATIMDVFGLLIFCWVSQLIITTFVG